MKSIFKVLLLIVLILVGKWEKGNHLILGKPTNPVYSPIYTQNTTFNLQPDNLQADNYQEQGIRRISVNYNNQ